LPEAADTDPVSGNVLSALARLAERRFQSFSEAADGVLDLLEGELPAGSLLLGQVDSEEGELRLIDVRGEAAKAIHAGSTLPLAQHLNGDGGGLLDPATLQELSVRSYLAMPLQTHGGGAITLCALSSGTDLFTRSHLELLAVAGRLLAYEWESVKWRADLRRLNERLRDPERTDALTGLLNRTAFIEALEHEWRLAERGSTESYLLACRLANLSEVTERHGAGLGELLLRDSADVMEEAIRRTDHAGRLGEDVFGAVLVGCKGPEGADAFFGRFQHALARVTSERPATLEVAYAVLALGRAESPEEALRDIEKAAKKAKVALAGGTA
jgi:diguanylate cyclase (GGDEF)-like protein